MNKTLERSCFRLSSNQQAIRKVYIIPFNPPSYTESDWAKAYTTSTIQENALSVKKTSGNTSNFSHPPSLSLFMGSGTHSGAADRELSELNDLSRGDDVISVLSSEMMERAVSWLTSQHTRLPTCFTQVPVKHDRR